MVDGPMGTRHRHRYRTRSGRVVPASLVVAGLLLAACGGGGGDSGVAALGDEGAPTGDGSTDTAATEAELMEYTECLRAQGVQVNDPVVDENGDASFGGMMLQAESEEEIERLQDRVQAAMEVCGEPPGGGFADRSGVDQTEMQDAVLAFAECMRDNGIDFPDPDFSSGGVAMGGSESGLDPNDPAFQEAMAECQDTLSDQFGEGGPQIRGPG